MAKEKTSDEGFEVESQQPPPGFGDGRLAKRPGAVDTYRWISFWLEPSIEATDTFFKQVLGPQWLGESPSPMCVCVCCARPW